MPLHSVSADSNVHVPFVKDLVLCVTTKDQVLFSSCTFSSLCTAKDKFCSRNQCYNVHQSVLPLFEKTELQEMCTMWFHVISQYRTRQVLSVQRMPCLLYYR